MYSLSDYQTFFSPLKFSFKLKEQTTDPQRKQSSKDQDKFSYFPLSGHPSLTAHTNIVCSHNWVTEGYGSDWKGAGEPKAKD